jgi:hypothetical protein
MRGIVAKLMEFDDVNQLIGEIMTGLAIRLRSRVGARRRRKADRRQADRP